MVTMVHLWEEGDEYLLQIASVASRWLESRQPPKPLLATTDFCDLMATLHGECLFLRFAYE